MEYKDYHPIALSYWLDLCKATRGQRHTCGKRAFPCQLCSLLPEGRTKNGHGKWCGCHSSSRHWQGVVNAAAALLSSPCSASKRNYSTFYTWQIYNAESTWVCHCTVGSAVSLCSEVQSEGLGSGEWRSNIHLTYLLLWKLGVDRYRFLRADADTDFFFNQP